MNKLSIIIAYRADGGLRTKQKIWTVNRYQKIFPEAQIIISQDKKGIGWEGFCKSHWINRGVRKAKGDILLITDIDVVLSKENILKAIEKLDGHCLVVPYNVMYKLTSGTSSKVMSVAGGKNLPVVDLSKQKKIVLKENHPQGIAIITKENFLKAGGYDERFVGWGSEDGAFQTAVRTMCGDTLLQLDGIAYHLKHPIVKNRHHLRNAAVGEIVQEYRDATLNKTRMMDILRKRGVL